jgi:hypothetical protein
MRVHTVVYSRYCNPDRLLDSIAQVLDEVNALLQTLSINDVLDIRFETGSCIPETSDIQGKMFHTAHVIYLQ